MKKLKLLSMFILSGTFALAQSVATGIPDSAKTIAYPNSTGAYTIINPLGHNGTTGFANAPQNMSCFNNCKSDYIYFYDLDMNLPGNASITGVEVIHTAAGCNSGSYTIDSLRLAHNGTIISNAKRDSVTTFTTKTFGSNNDLWSASLTPAMVNSNSFGVIINSTSSGICTYGQYDLQVKIYYTQGENADSCMNFAPYATMGNQFDNDSIYPIGSTLMQTGYIQITKPFSSVGAPPNLTSGAMFQGDSVICYVGSLDIDISTTPYNNKKLTFSTIAPMGMVVDGTTVFNNSAPPVSFNGPGFTYSYFSTYHTITGNFDVVRVLGGTNCMADICLEEILSTSISTTNKKSIEITLYPNPANDNIQLSISHFEKDLNYQIYDLTGKTILNGRIENKETLLNISSLSKGMYFIQVQSETIQTIKFIKD